MPAKVFPVVHLQDPVVRGDLTATRTLNQTPTSGQGTGRAGGNPCLETSSWRLHAEPVDTECGEAEEEEEPGDIGDGSDENAGGQGGVDLEQLQAVRDEHPESRSGDHVQQHGDGEDRKSTRLNSSHSSVSRMPSSA